MTTHTTKVGTLALVYRPHPATVAVARGAAVALNNKPIRPCHSIHCRHYDLADGFACEVEAARLIAHEVTR